MNGRDPFPDLVMRPVSTEDADDLVAAMRTLSIESLYKRFFTVPPDPTPLVTRHLALVDHQDHEGIVVLDGADIVAVAQWDRSADDPEAAEVAVLVVDGWQRRGLGRALVRAAAGDAHRHGVNTLLASVLTENRGGFGLANRQHPSDVHVDGAETTFRFDLAS